ncbi:MAG: hypothetical protein ACKOAO_11175 [Oxalobacteraceae bacterium]
MYVLSVEDIDLMIALANNGKLPSEFIRHEKQMDKLIYMGILRPGGGVLALTELGYKTANALMGRCLGSNIDGPPQPVANKHAQAMVDPESDTSDDASAAAIETTGTAAAPEAGGESGADADAATEPA